MYLSYFFSLVFVIGFLDASHAFSWPWKTNEEGNNVENREFPTAPEETPAALDVLHQAAARGDRQALEMLLSRNFDINRKDENGWQPLHEAVTHGDVDVVTFLVEHGSQLGEKTYAGGTPLWWSRRLHGEEHPVTRYLVDIKAPFEGDDVTLSMEPENDETDGSTELHIVAAEGNLEAAKDIISRHKYLVNAKDANGWQPLHEAVNSGALEIVELLLLSGADINSRSFEGGSPLWWSRRIHGPNHPVTVFLESRGAKEHDSDE